MDGWLKKQVKFIVKIFFVLGIVFTVFGIALGIFSSVRQLYFHQIGASAPGEIYAMYYQGYAIAPTENSGSQLTWSNQVRIYIRFTTNDAEEVIAPVHYFSSDMRIGQRLNVSYNPDNPTSFVTDSPAPFQMSGVFGGVGLVITSIFVVFGLVTKTRIRRCPGTIFDFEWRPL